MDLTGLIDKHKNKILNIVVIILALIIAGNIYKKQLKETELLKREKDGEIKKNTLLNNITQLEKRINAYKNLLAKRDTGLVINTISNIAKESGVKITSLKPGYEQRYPEYIKFGFDLMIATASYHTLGTFISAVESLRDVYMIDSLDIRYEGGTKGLAVNLKLSTVQFTN